MNPFLSFGVCTLGLIALLIVSLACCEAIFDECRKEYDQ